METEEEVLEEGLDDDYEQDSYEQDNYEDEGFTFQGNQWLQGHTCKPLDQDLNDLFGF